MSSLGLTRAELDQVWARVRAVRNWWLSLPAFTHNVGAIFRHRLLHPEDEIFYVTARATETAGLPIMHQSQRWLDMCGIGGVGTAVIVVPEGVRKIDVYEQIGVEYAIDDCLDIVEQGTHVIYLLSRPWNQQGRSPGLDVVESLDEFFAKTRR